MAVRNKKTRETKYLEQVARLKRAAVELYDALDALDARPLAPGTYAILHFLTQLLAVQVDEVWVARYLAARGGPKKPKKEPK